MAHTHNTHTTNHTYTDEQRALLVESAIDLAHYWWDCCYGDPDEDEGYMANHDRWVEIASRLEEGGYLSEEEEAELQEWKEENADEYEYENDEWEDYEEDTDEYEWDETELQICEK